MIPRTGRLRYQFRIFPASQPALCIEVRSVPSVVEGYTIHLLHEEGGTSIAAWRRQGVKAAIDKADQLMEVLA